MPEDVLTIALPGGIKVLRVVEPGVRRGPAPEASLLYEDLSPPPLPREQRALEPIRVPRPDKRQRREILKLRRPNAGTFSDGGDT